MSGKLIISEPETVQLANLEAAADHSSFLWSHTTTRVSILSRDLARGECEGDVWGGKNVGGFKTREIELRVAAHQVAAACLQRPRASTYQKPKTVTP